MPAQTSSSKRQANMNTEKINAPDEISGYAIHNDFLKNKIVGLSVSDSDDMRSLGFTGRHVNSMFTELSRYIIVKGGKLAYGGDLRHKGYTETILKLVNSYQLDKDASEIAWSYLAWPVYEAKEVPTDEYNHVKFITCKPPSGSDNLEINDVLEADENAEKYIFAKSLTSMRMEMNSNIHARIATGGRLTDFKGKYPGIVEEVFLAMQSEIPCYLIGVFGGATKAVIDLISGHSNKELTKKFQTESDPGYESFYSYYNRAENDSTESTDGFNFNEIKAFFRNKGIKGLNNGLSVEENEVLFTSRDTSRIISLIMKGFKKTLK